jgi:hypothetical protein
MVPVQCEGPVTLDMTTASVFRFVTKVQHQLPSMVLFGGECTVRRLWGRVAGTGCIVVFYLLLPVLPLLAALLFWRRHYLLNYGHSLRKMQIHIQALSRGPAVHYFQDVLGRARQVPQDMLGECVQCGNCCMDHQCAFLMQIDDKRYQCGIYHSPLRRFSNCSSFPLNEYDIARYACPSYFTAGGRPVTPGVHTIAVADIRRAPVAPVGR